MLVVAIGSSAAAANARTALAAGTRWGAATTAFATGSEPSPARAGNGLRRRGARQLVIAP